MIETKLFQSSNSGIFLRRINLSKKLPTISGEIVKAREAYTREKPFFRMHEKRHGIYLYTVQLWVYIRKWILQIVL